MHHFQHINSIFGSLLTLSSSDSNSRASSSTFNGGLLNFWPEGPGFSSFCSTIVKKLVTFVCLTTLDFSNASNVVWAHFWQVTQLCVPLCTLTFFNWMSNRHLWLCKTFLSKPNFERPKGKNVAIQIKLLVEKTSNNGNSGICGWILKIFLLPRPLRKLWCAHAIKNVIWEKNYRGFYFNLLSTIKRQLSGIPKPYYTGEFGQNSTVCNPY